MRVYSVHACADAHTQAWLHGEGIAGGGGAAAEPHNLECGAQQDHAAAD